MSNAFDIERARAGDPVEHKVNLSGNWEPVHFVGKAIDGTPVIQVGRNVFACDEAYLRIARKKVKVRYRNYKLCDAVAAGVSMIIDGPGWETPAVIEKKSWFRGWIHNEWQEAEVEQ